MRVWRACTRRNRAAGLAHLARACLGLGIHQSVCWHRPLTQQAPRASTSRPFPPTRTRLSTPRKWARGALVAATGWAPVVQRQGCCREATGSIPGWPANELIYMLSMSCLRSCPHRLLPGTFRGRRQRRCTQRSRRGHHTRHTHRPGHPSHPSRGRRPTHPHRRRESWKMGSCCHRREQHRGAG